MYQAASVNQSCQARSYDLNVDHSREHPHARDMFNLHKSAHYQATAQTVRVDWNIRPKSGIYLTPTLSQFWVLS